MTKVHAKEAAFKDMTKKARRVPPQTLQRQTPPTNVRDTLQTLSLSLATMSADEAIAGQWAVPVAN